ncbi:MAG TPA: helix-turn-helix domain-containing protein [Actinomadura sp.]|jgi:DNA-binding transcriptional ArsR family regulator|nr:helix-turn-helix domain-containing protein [Actinomadura sp.]
MLRIHFTLEDLARTRIAAEPDMMWEIVLSVHLLQHRGGAAVFEDWRRHARRRLREWVRPLLTLAPHAAYFPDFLTPAEPSPSFEKGIESVLTTPHARIHADLERLAAHRRLPNWTRRLAQGDSRALGDLGQALRAYRNAVIDTCWPSVQTYVEGDRSRRLRALADGGVEGLLASFRPLMRWNPPVLEVGYPVAQDLVLNGRGLLLVPSYFCWRTPVTLADPELRPVLVYPVTRDLRHGAEDGGAARLAGGELGALLGNTRAAILRAVRDGCTTTELSRRAGTSVASASQHATVLRMAGLITTQRYSGSALHSVTPLGSRLLTAN